METNYELKHKCLLVPLKAVLLVLVMLLVGFTSYAQTGKSVRVANNEQLIEALQNPAIGTIELAAGYYAYLNYQAPEGAKVMIKDSGNGNRADCTYFIIDRDVCFDQPPGTFVLNQAKAGTLPTGFCPADDSGLWTVEGGPGNVNLLSGLNEYDMLFEVDQPGSYSLRYTWAAFSTFVETEYFFYGPETVTLSAPDVCEIDGLFTTVTFSRTSAQPDPGTNVVWTLNGLPYVGPTTSGQFTLTVPECGLYELCVTVEPTLCPPVTECIVIDFSCQPYADAGPDINVCNELCVYLVGSTGLTVYSPASAYSWYQTSGPGTLNFDPDQDLVYPFETTVQACIDPIPACEYGEYTVEFQVQNGECYDEDDAIIRFYQQPVAEAGTIAPICDDFTFNLGATPFVYCGVEGTNYWSTAYWELVSYPAGAVVAITDEELANTEVSITGAAGVCLYGDYTFRWVEQNSKGANLGGCYAEDFVTVTIVEDPEPDAGEELVLCNTFEFDLFGYGDEPCNDDYEPTYSWEKTAEPGNCNVVITGGNTLNPSVAISGCDDACEYGKYTFELTQSNDGVCEGTDSVDVWILEPAIADAGDDQHICNSFAFTVQADLTAFCGVEGVNYFPGGTWEFVSGPKPVTLVTVNDSTATVTVNDLTGCPTGVYTFKWTEYNGFWDGTVFTGCSDDDEVSIYIYEQPEVLAGDNQEYCDVRSFQLDGTVDELCNDGWYYQIDWNLVSQPGTCDVNFQYENSIDPLVTITNCGTSCPYGEYKFMVTQNNGYYDDNGNFVGISALYNEV
ncbi:MAG: hypothetical protein HGA37_05000, partial [Lentimicrobium sp.]|nr:hypothetical protein [Lentimicrobium sp.]